MPIMLMLQADECARFTFCICICIRHCISVYGIFKNSHLFVAIRSSHLVLLLSALAPSGLYRNSDIPPLAEVREVVAGHKCLQFA